MSYVMLGQSADAPSDPTFETPQMTEPTPPAGADAGAASPAGAQIDPELVKQFGPIAATLGMSLAQFLSSIGVAIRYVAVSEEERRRRAAAAAEFSRRPDWSRFFGPALVLGLGGFVAFQIAKKRRRGADSAA